jgi:two-component system, chemotaxis family, response regulator Rcp1
MLLMTEITETRSIHAVVFFSMMTESLVSFESTGSSALSSRASVAEMNTPLKKWPVQSGPSVSSAAVAGRVWSMPLEDDRSSSSPRPVPPEPREDGNTESPARARASSVLLIEDNPSDVYVIRQVLNGCGVSIRLFVATDGEEALSMLEASTETFQGSEPSLILLDWNLPKLSGAEVLAYLRGTDRWRDTPVVVVTSTNSPAERREMNRLGAAHFRKPTDLDAYLDLAKIVVEKLPRTSTA